MIGIIDYGMGNIHSVQKALESQGAKTLVVARPEEFISCRKLVLPGVGAFRDAMLELEKRRFIQAIIQAIKEKKVFLGICLGMQLLFEESEEAVNIRGLGLLKGMVKKFKAGNALKVPQMGWNQLTRAGRECMLLKGIEDKAYVYFCHSYYPQPAEKEIVAATCDYGIEFAAVVAKDNIYAAQFHPEKSQEIGLAMLKNFIEIC